MFFFAQGSAWAEVGFGFDLNAQYAIRTQNSVNDLYSGSSRALRVFWASGDHDIGLSLSYGRISGNLSSVTPSPIDELVLSPYFRYFVGGKETAFIHGAVVMNKQNSSDGNSLGYGFNAGPGVQIEINKSLSLPISLKLNYEFHSTPSTFTKKSLLLELGLNLYLR